MWKSNNFITKLIYFLSTFRGKYKMTNTPIPDNEFDDSLDIDIGHYARLNTEDRKIYLRCINKKRALAHDNYINRKVK